MEWLPQRDSVYPAAMNGTRAWTNLALATVVVGLGLSGTGCKKLIQKRLAAMDAGAGAGPTAAGSANLSPQDLADEQMQDKLDDYIKCLNSISSNVFRARSRYLYYIPKAGPKGTERDADIYQLSSGNTAQCTTGVGKAKTMPPRDGKLESVGDEYAAAAANVDTAINDMHSYFQMKSWKDDKWAKGKAMHPALMAAFERFSKADHAMHDTLDGITKPLNQRALLRLEKEEGKKFRYWRKKTMIAAREMIEAANPSGEDEDIDFSLYQANYTEFEKSLDELQAYGNAHKPDLEGKQNPAWPLAASHYDTFVKEGTDFKIASKEFWRCLRDAPPKAKSPTGKIDLSKAGNCDNQPAWRSAENTLKKYNEFVRASNNNQFP